MTSSPLDQVRDLLLILKGLEHERDHFYTEYHHAKNAWEKSEQEAQQQLGSKAQEMAMLEGRLANLVKSNEDVHLNYKEALEKINAQKLQMEEYQKKIVADDLQISHWNEFYNSLKKEMHLDAETEEGILRSAKVRYESCQTYNSIKLRLGLSPESCDEDVLATIKEMAALSKKYKEDHLQKSAPQNERQKSLFLEKERLSSPRTLRSLLHDVTSALAASALYTCVLLTAWYPTAHLYKSESKHAESELILAEDAEYTGYAGKRDFTLRSSELSVLFQEVFQEDLQDFGEKWGYLAGTDADKTLLPITVSSSPSSGSGVINPLTSGTSSAPALPKESVSHESVSPVSNKLTAPIAISTTTPTISPITTPITSPMTSRINVGVGAINIKDKMNEAHYQNACASKKISFPSGLKPEHWADYSCQPLREGCLPASKYVTQQLAAEKHLCNGCCKKELVCCPPSPLPALPPAPAPVLTPVPTPAPTARPAVIALPIPTPVPTILTQTLPNDATSTSSSPTPSSPTSSSFPTPAALSCPNSIMYEQRNKDLCTFTLPSQPVLKQCTIVYTLEHDTVIKKYSKNINVGQNKSFNFVLGEYCATVGYPCSANLEIVCSDAVNVNQPSMKGKTIILAETKPEDESKDKLDEKKKNDEENKPSAENKPDGGTP